ncbi:MAG: zinc ribbon domain-containing protein [Patescibacteria group bacterium]|nr:zinc ribbon domain-containing protein [Patescibacteria group bacterium]
MKELTDSEIQWLEAFAKHHEFFASFLLHYKLKQYLSNNQYYWFHLYINQAEEQGDTLLNTSEIEFFEEFSTGNENLTAIFSIYEDKGYLDKRKYEELLSLKAEMMGVPKEVKAPESLFKYKVVKVPCPHCSFLCSPHIQFCSKCGERLPKLEKLNEVTGTSEIYDEDYTEKNIIHSLDNSIFLLNFLLNPWLLVFL